MSILKLPEVFAERVYSLKEPFTLVVNDATRPSPQEYISALEPFLPERFRILFATGAHRPVSDSEQKKILGGFAKPVIDIASNNCDDGSHITLGTTSRGTPVDVHPWLLEGSVLAVNTVEPHYFAGFTGGRKSFLPGCSSRRTIAANHFLACLPGTLPGKLFGNPVHLDMAEGAAFLTSEFECLMINGVRGGEEFFCGSPEESFLSAVEASSERFAVPITEMHDSLELFPGESLEVSLYQSMKAVFMWGAAVIDGGDLVLTSPCPEGLGAPQMERLLRASQGKPVPPASQAEYFLGDHAALRLSRLRKRVKLSFRTGIPMDAFGFKEPPLSCRDTVTEAGFFYPVMAGDDAEHF